MRTIKYVSPENGGRLSGWYDVALYPAGTPMGMSGRPDWTTARALGGHPAGRTPDVERAEGGFDRRDVDRAVAS